MHQGLRACRSFRRVYSVIIRSYLSPVLHCVSRESPKMRFIVANGKHSLHILPHLTVTWTVLHETKQSHPVPRLRMNISYTPHSIRLHAVQNEHFTWDFPSSVVSWRRFLPTFRTIYRTHIQGSSSPGSSWTAETDLHRAQRPGIVKVFFKTRLKPEITQIFTYITAT